MGNDAGWRDTLSSGKRGYRQQLDKEREIVVASDDNLSEQGVDDTTCSKKADPTRLWLGL